ncbi:MAG: hypothetical protein R2715_19800 [Ilumatobacteraceae bacterium]
MIPSDASVARNTAEVLLSTVLPTIDDPHVRATVLQLAAVTRWHAERDSTTPAGREAAQETVLAAHDARSILGLPDASTSTVAGAVLVGAVDPMCDERVRACAAELRPLLLADLDADLAAEAPLIDAFRGRMPS